MRLPLNSVELSEGFGLQEDLGSVGSEDLEVVVNFESLVQDLSEEVSSTG